MRLLVSMLLIIGLVGCGSSQLTYNGGGQFTVQRLEPVSYERMRDLKVTNADCPAIDTIVNKIEDSLRLKGLLYRDPSTFNDDDRKYNAYARTKIWALRIGCANPNRYDRFNK